MDGLFLSRTNNINSDLAQHVGSDSGICGGRIDLKINRIRPVYSQLSWAFKPHLVA